MANKSNGVESEWARAPPPNAPFVERCLRAIYDPDEKTLLGRTPKRWGIIITFYLVFYAVLAALFAICMAGLFSVLKDDKPLYILEKSLIGVNPGVACRPQPLDGFIHYNIENSTAFETYVEELRQFIEPYQNESWYTSRKECTSEDNFGYPMTPCFFIKLNKIYGWKPDYYTDLPSDMPLELTEHIVSHPEVDRQQVWISCWGEHSNETKIEYPWGMGLPGRFYPFLNNEGYISPLIAIKLSPPSNIQSVIRCRAWAKNIIYNKSLKEPSGYARMVLQVDDNFSTNHTKTENSM
ncbi:unnamed protein product, partial [Brenthis ino]